MVKPLPRIRNTLAKRRKKVMDLRHHKLRETLLLNSNTNSNTQNSVSLTLSPSSDHHLQHHLPHVQQQQQQTKTDNSYSRPQNEAPLSPIQQPLKKKKRSRSPDYTSSTYATCSSSSSPPHSPSSLSSPLKNSPTFLIPFPNSPHICHTQQSLRRTVSDPPIFSSESTAGDSSSSKRMSNVKQEPSESPKVCRNLMAQLLPPLPPPPSPKLLRRTISDPVPLLSNTKVKNEKEEMKDQMVKAEKLSGEWTMIKLNCTCGSQVHFLYCGADNKCYKLV